MNNSNSPYRLEICANSAQSCIEAQNGGAYRVELCAAIPEGGTTPSYGEMAVARESIDIKLNVIIRPRGGDFLYSPLERDIMIKDIQNAVRLGVDGIVIGCLTPDGQIDTALANELIQEANGLSVTFHRAFDMCKDPHKALEQIIQLGCHRILTSGQQPTAEQGIPLIAQLVEQADNRIIIMPGSGVNPHNVAKIAQATNAVEFHLSARHAIPSNMIFRNPNLSMANNPLVINEYENQVTSAHIVRQTLDRLINQSV
ncbi:MAG: copper homeostasis protein CutC [Fermentimonas sp.]|jgi:copper homeostasis protein